MDAQLLENTVTSTVATRLVSASKRNEDIVPVITKFLSGLAEEEEEVSLLLMEENTELTAFITTSLPNYKISLATNEAEGLQKVFTLMPDLVMINVGAPAINGYECCKKIKKDECTDHIPVVLIMSSTISDTLIKELASGADEYLFKPFSKEELCLRVKKVVAGQPRLQKEFFNNEISNPATLERVITAPTDLVSKNLFLRKIYTIIDKNLDDTDFDVTKLAAQLLISNANLHRKLKATSCPAPVRIITNYRLQWASYYLKKGYNSSQTAYKTGFNSPAYFSKCFKNRYGMTPREFCRQ